MAIKLSRLGLCAPLAALAFLPVTANAQGSPGNDMVNLHFKGTGDNAKKVLFIPVRYPNGSGFVPPPGTLVQVENMAQTFTDYMDENSYGKLEIDWTIATVSNTPITMPNSYDYYDNLGSDVLARIRADAVDAAAAAGYPEGSYDREVILSDKVWSGPSNIGGVNYRTIFASGTNAVVLSHEFGHTLGWQHANFLEVSDDGMGNYPPPYAMPPTNSPDNYGDPFDMMGEGLSTPNACGNTFDFHHYHPWSKRRAGWLRARDVRTITVDELDLYEGTMGSGGGPYTVVSIEPIASPLSNVKKAIRIPKNGLNDYWIFWREGELCVGAPPTLSCVNDGATISYGFHFPQARTLLLDVNPGSQPVTQTPACRPRWDAKDSRLVLNQSFIDPDAGFKIKVVGSYSNRLDVRIEPYGTNGSTFGLVDQLPKIDVLQPARQVTVKAGQLFEVAAEDPDSGESITSVEMWIVNPGLDTCSTPTASYPPQGPPSGCEETGSGLITTTNAAGNYEWTLPTGGVATNGVYNLVIRATSTGAGDNVYWFNLIVDEDA